MYALKRNDFIFITGQCGSAKSSLIRLVERTINKQMSTVNVSQLKNSSLLFPSKNKQRLFLDLIFLRLILTKMKNKN